MPDFFIIGNNHFRKNGFFFVTEMSTMDYPANR